MKPDLSKPTVPGVYRCTRKIDGMSQTVYRYYKGGDCLYTDDWANPTNTVGEKVEHLRHYQGPFVLMKEVREPEVIEGDDFTVGEGREGWYWYTSVGSNKPPDRVYKRAFDDFKKGFRYIKTEPPTFPPPLPPKPELKLYRVKDHTTAMIVNEMFWGFVDARGRIYPGNFDPAQLEEVKDD